MCRSLLKHSHQKQWEVDPFETTEREIDGIKFLFRPLVLDDLEGGEPATKVTIYNGTHVTIKVEFSLQIDWQDRRLKVNSRTYWIHPGKSKSILLPPQEQVHISIC